MVHEAVEERGDGRRVAEEFWPVGEWTIRGDDRRRALVARSGASRLRGGPQRRWQGVCATRGRQLQARAGPSSCVRTRGTKERR